MPSSWMVTLVPNLDHIACHIGFIDHPCCCQDDLKLLDAAFHKSLLILGSFIFCVFDQFATLHGFMQAVGNLFTLTGSQEIKLFLAFFDTLHESKMRLSCPILFPLGESENQPPRKYNLQSLQTKQKHS